MFFLAYAWLPGAIGPPGPQRRVSNVTLPANLESLEGRTRVDALQVILANIGVRGEIGYVQHNVKERTLVFPVLVPRRETILLLSACC